MMTTEKKSNLRMKRAEQRRKEKEFLEILLQLSEDLPWQHKWWNLVSPEFREKDWIQAMYQELVHGRVPGLQTLRQCLGDPISPTIIVRMNLIGLILEVTNLERQYCAKVCKINITQLRRLQELVEMCDEVIARMPEIAQNPQVQELMKELKNWLAVEKQHYQDSTAQSSVSESLSGELTQGNPGRLRNGRRANAACRSGQPGCTAEMRAGHQYSAGKPVYSECIEGRD